MGNTVDNCCVCGAGTILHAAVRASYLWVGWEPFTSGGPALDHYGLKYRTCTVTIFDLLGAAVTKSISVDPYNSTFIDTTTGESADSYNWGGISGLWLPAWPPDLPLTDTVAQWSSGESIVLSDPVDADWARARAQECLDAVALSGLTPGTDSKLVSFDPVFIGDPAVVTQTGGGGFGWMSLGVFVTADAGMFFAWGDIAGAIFTARGSMPAGPFTAHPFEHVTPAVKVDLDDLDFPPSPGSFNFYSQSASWGMRKSLSTPVAAPVCCSDNFGGDNPTPPATLCQMIADDGSGHLILNPPALSFTIADNSDYIVRYPWFGTALTGGGCPCA